MFSENLVQLRKLNDMTQEDLAEAVGVTRQAIAKWESGDSVPDLERSKAIADAFGVSLDDLANYDPEDNMGMGVAPKGKHIFGMVTVGEKGQIVIPAKARKLFKIESALYLFPRRVIACLGHLSLGSPSPKDVNSKLISFF